MLRLAVARSNVCLEQGLRTGGRRQWQPQRIGRAVKRAYADQNTVAGVPTGPIGAQRGTTSTPITSAQSTPPTSTLPPTGTGSASTGPASISPPPPPPKKPRRRLRTFLLSLFILSTLGYAGSVFLALRNDNFHDFFTEYIPFGEDAVAYFEERNFRKRFPTHEYAGARTWPQRKGEQKVTIGRSSGLTPRETTDPGTSGGSKGRHNSAVEDNKQPVKEEQGKQAKPEGGDSKGTAEKAKDAVVQTTQAAIGPKADTADKAKVKQDGAASADAKPKVMPAPKQDAKLAESTAKAKAPEPKPAPASPPSPPAEPVQQIDHINVAEATEPVVQDVVKLLNNIITAVNESPDASKYRTTLISAKDQVHSIIGNITTLKDQYSHDAESKIKDAHQEFDAAAKELVSRVEREMQDQEVKWREEYEAERERLSSSWRQKLGLELDAKTKVEEEKRQNALLEREIVLQRKFMDDVKNHIETERDGRLAKLEELSSSVSELENLTTQWNGVVDATLQTQHLQVALEAVRSKIQASDSVDFPVPFLNELVALKEVSADSELVNAAISSIPPVAYQRGIPSAAHLIDRFRRVASEVRKASLLPEDAGVASHAASAVLSRLMFAKKADRGLPEGEDVEATLARSEVLLEEGDLDAAAREMNNLKGWAGVLSRDWVGECRRVLEVRQAVDVIAAEARLQSLLVD